MNEMNKATSIDFENITFAYPGSSVAAVTDITLSVRPAELVVIVGPSGCGKSTLLRIVAGLVQPSRGRLLLDGADTLKLPPEKRRIGWVPQSYALFDHLDVSGNVAFGLRMQGVGKAQRERRVQEMLELCRISQFAHRPVGELSGGQRQRVAIARALATHPRVLLLDEPLAALDPQLRVAIRADLEALLRRSGVTTLFVTHDQSEALAIADRVVVLRDGRIEQYDTPERLWTRPANAFVAEFVSRAIALKGQLRADGTVELAPGLVAHCDLPAPTASGTVTVTLRPTDLVLHAEGVPAEVTACEYAGGTYVVFGRLSTGSPVSFLASERLGIGQSAKVAVRDGVRLNVLAE